ncbi:MAG: HD domain-containing protein [Ktedonobacteraceae bacterium]|nr:HD domain-containing protein [Ktedonobacteraceae bacterium]
MSDKAHILARTRQEVQRRFADIDDLAHGWEHIERVYRLAEYIARQEGADIFIVGMAALLHDLGRAMPQHEKQHGRGEHHADLSVKLAGQFLRHYRLAAETCEAIEHAILAHSFSRGVDPRTLEAKVVRDADRLDGLGAIGILRWAQTGTVRRTPHTHSYHPSDPFGQQRELDDTTYMLDHFYTKLLKLGETMQTASGRELARRRTDFLRAYLAEFRRELLLE